ncbi:C10 family peptidase [Desulfobacter latus]|uniref:C10 family peptidase n=1 Tax=Desulfobacter latus TaxID=2292 RepID=A0A850SVN5_9BACT|nr:C10 family peptidase [Desulfobacter latus]NWH05414.1 C10 family peptidase [Desulfobacter latus]
MSNQYVKVRTPSAFVVFTLFLLIFLSPAFALTTQDKAEIIAENFIAYAKRFKTIEKVRPLETNLAGAESPVLSGWIIDLSDKGYIVLPSSTAAYPIKAYSFDTKFDDLPEPFKIFIKKELEARARAGDAAPKRTSLVSEALTPEQTARNLLLTWDEKEHRRVAQAYTPSDFLVKTQWNQGFPYNKFLPEIDGQNVATGCVNTALAQVMKYHGHPRSGRGISSSYTWNNQELTVILHHPYYWTNMPDTPGMSAQPHIQDEIAILFKDIGIINKTQFGITESSAYLHKDSVIKHLGFSNTMATMSNSNTDAFFSTLKAQIDQELPVLLSLPGHMVIADGYHEDGTGRNFHLNMGWGGTDNNFYYLDQNIVTTNKIYPPSLEMIYNVKPCTGPDCESPDPVTQSMPPVLNNRFDDLILKENASTLKIRVDARDGNGDAVILKTISSNPDAVSAALENDILSLTPLQGSSGNAATVRVTAEAGGQAVSKDFLVVITGDAITLGPSQNQTGKFGSQDAVYTHKIILQGACTISGDRGYSNQAFYMGLKNSRGQVIVAITDDFGAADIPSPLPLDVYTLSVSLKSGGWFYPYTQGDHDEYVIQVKAPDFSASTSQLADLLGVDMSRTVFTVPGDVDGDFQVTVADKILELRMLTHGGDLPEWDQGDDTSGNGTIGIEDVIYWP